MALNKRARCTETSPVDFKETGKARAAQFEQGAILKGAILGTAGTASQAAIHESPTVAGNLLPDT